MSDDPEFDSKIVHIRDTFKSLELTPYTINNWAEGKHECPRVVSLHGDIVELMGQLTGLQIKTREDFQLWCKGVNTAQVG